MAHPNFQGLHPTGRQMKDPAATLYELEGDDGRIYTSIAYDERYWGAEALTLNVQLVESFMEYPMVVGLVELARHDLPTATFSYPTGRVFTLMDVLRTYRDLNLAPGPRAALEMTLLAAEILDEAGQTGPIQGCFSHGNLNPWRIAIRLDGELQVFGYGLAHVDLIAHRKDPSRFALTPESLRYAPPERIEGQPEGPSADIYSLTACAFELATGKPLYDTLDLAELQRMIALSEGTSILSGRGHGLPPQMAKTFARAMIYDPDTRLSGGEFVDEIKTLLQRPDVEGDGLAAIMEKLRGQQIVTAPKGRKLVASTGTELFTASQLKQQMLEDDDDDEAAPAQEESRWGRVSRRRDTPSVTPAAPAPTPSADPEAGARRLRRRTEEPEPPVAPAPVADDGGVRRRLRRGADEPVSVPPPAPAPTTPAPAPMSTEPTEGGIRRLRRTTPDEPVAPPPTSVPPASEESPLRRRLRRGGDEPAPEPTPAPAAEATDDDGSRLRRLRRLRTEEEGARPEPPPEPDPTSPEPGTPLRRLRRGT